MKICKCGKNKELIVKNKIKKQLLDEGYILPGKSLPMKAVVDILKIDIDYLREMSK